MKVPVYTENEYFVFTISHKPHIIDLFESTELYYEEDNTTACGSSFATKEEAIAFSEKIDRLKIECGEMNYIVKRSLSHLWIHNLFTKDKHSAIVPVCIGGVMCGLIN